MYMIHTNILIALADVMPKFTHRFFAAEEWKRYEIDMILSKMFKH